MRAMGKNVMSKKKNNEKTKMAFISNEQKDKDEEIRTILQPMLKSDRLKGK